MLKSRLAKRVDKLERDLVESTAAMKLLAEAVVESMGRVETEIKSLKAGTETNGRWCKELEVGLDRFIGARVVKRLTNVEQVARDLDAGMERLKSSRPKMGPGWGLGGK